MSIHIYIKYIVRYRFTYKCQFFSRLKRWVTLMNWVRLWSYYKSFVHLLFLELWPRTFSSVTCVTISHSISPIQHFKVGSTLFQRCGSTLKQLWSDIENETKSDFGFSTLHNVDITSVPQVETTLIQRCFNLSLFQPIAGVS